MHTMHEPVLDSDAASNLTPGDVVHIQTERGPKVRRVTMVNGSTVSTVPEPAPYVPGPPNRKQRRAQLAEMRRIIRKAQRQ